MSLATGDLTTPADVQAYLSSQPTDTVVRGMVPRISRMILSYINRSLIVPKTYTDQINGTGTNMLVLPNWPVLSVSSLVVSGQSLSISPQSGSAGSFSLPYGYRFQPWDGLPPSSAAVLEGTGGVCFWRGNQNVVVTYKAGYQVTGEVPNATTYTPLTPYGIWATDEGVFYTSSGTQLVAVTSGPPAVGHYIAPTPEATTPVLTYTFNATDIASGLLINYGFVPADLEQAAIEWIGERLAYRLRMGVRSQSLAAQETITFDLSGVPKYIQAMCNPYVSVIPPNIGASA